MLLREITVTFRDNSSLLIRELDWERGILAQQLEADARKVQEETLRKAIELDEEAGLELEAATRVRNLFAINFYPRMAASVVGIPPTVDEAYSMPAVELNKWYAAVREVNIEWYAEEDAAIAALSEREVQKKDGMNEPELPEESLTS